jgi:hypothetical protein
VGACTRCGTFVCGADAKTVDGALYCETCAARPDVDYLEAFRLQYWGKRDTWAWLIGLGNLVNVPVIFVFFATNQPLYALLSIYSSVVSVCFWLGLPWARYGLLVGQLLGTGITLFSTGLGGAGAVGGGAGGLIGLVITAAILNDTRNQLFFKVDVPRKKLRKAWDLYSNNSIARTGFLLGLVGLLLPPLGLIGVICSVIGLRRVDPNARPPIGRKGQAIAGIILGSLGTMWGFLFFFAALYNFFSSKP